MIAYRPQAYNSWANGQFMMPEVQMPQLQVNPTNQEPQAQAQNTPFAKVDNPFSEAFGAGADPVGGGEFTGRAAGNNFGATPMGSLERMGMGMMPGGGLLGLALAANNMAANEAGRASLGNPNGLNIGQIIGGLLGFNDYGRGLSPGLQASRNTAAYDDAQQQAGELGYYDLGHSGADQGRGAAEGHGGGLFGGFGFDGYY